MRKLFVLVCMMAVFVIGFALVSNAADAPKNLSEMKPTRWVTQSTSPFGEMTCETLVVWSKELKARTGGKLDLQIFPSDGLGYSQQGLLAVTRDGLMQVGTPTGSASQGEFPICAPMELWGLVPWDSKSMAPRIEAEKAMYPIFAKLYPERWNQYYLGAVLDDPWCIILKKKEVKTLADLKGLTLRVMGRHPGQVLSKLGVSPVTMPGSELYEALSTGVVDGVVSVNSFMASYKLYEVTKFGFAPNMGGSQDFYTVNKKAMDALPPDVQKMVIDSFKIAQAWRWDAIAKGYFEGRHDMEKGGVKYHDITREDWDKLSQICEPLLAEWVKAAGKDAPIAQQLIDVIKAAVKKARGQS